LDEDGDGIEVPRSGAKAEALSLKRDCPTPSERIYHRGNTVRATTGNLATSLHEDVRFSEAIPLDQLIEETEESNPLTLLGLSAKGALRI
jgi:hypothetical protein